MRSLELWTLAYLLNSLWQVPLVFAAAWLAARTMRRSGPTTEHRIWVAALALEAALPACPLRLDELLHRLAQFLISLFGLPPAGHFESITVITEFGTPHGIIPFSPRIFATIAIAYACTVLYFAGRLAWGILKTSALRRNSQPLTLSPNLEQSELAQCWSRCSRIFAVHDALLATSPAISSPITTGIVHRRILLPAGLQESLPQEDIDAAIAHEFAHMRRRDFAKNLFYELLSLPIAYHPLLWLTRTRIAQSREMVCDAMAANALAGPDRYARYARSLLRLASLFVHGTQPQTLHAIGIFDANIFERRIMSLTQKRIEPKGVCRLATAAVGLVIGLGACASALALRIELPIPTPAQSESQLPSSKPTARISGAVMAGNLLNKVNPVYPQAAKDAKISGTVVLSAVIGKDGAVEHLAVVSGPQELQKSALDAVSQWTYKPYLLNGNPIEVDTTITVNYSLRP